MPIPLTPAFYHPPDGVQELRVGKTVWWGEVKTNTCIAVETIQVNVSIMSTSEGVD